tara:strand:- start:30643 stop:30855 length:213 start_codon:yes stop_codon:yes gene_type:complete
MNTYQKQKSNYSLRRALIQQLVNVKVAENDQQRAEAHKKVKSLKMQLKAYEVKYCYYQANLITGDLGKIS